MDRNPEFAASLASVFHYIVEYVKEYEGRSVTTYLSLCSTCVGRSTGTVRSYEPSKVIRSSGLQRECTSY